MGICGAERAPKKTVDKEKGIMMTPLETCRSGAASGTQTPPHIRHVWLASHCRMRLWRELVPGYRKQHCPDHNGQGWAIHKNRLGLHFQTWQGQYGTSWPSSECERPKDTDTQTDARNLSRPQSFQVSYRIV